MILSTHRRGRWSAVAALAAVITCAGQTVASANQIPTGRTSIVHVRAAAASENNQRLIGRGTGTARWVRVEHVCAAPSRDQLSCMAEQVVPSHRGAVGAERVLTPSYSKGPAGGYTPADLASAYGYHPATGGTTQTVAIVDAYNDPRALSNLNAFDQHYHLPAETSTSFRQVNQAGRTSPLPRSDAGWSVEITLDIQAVRSVCNHCKILLVEASSPSAANLAAGVNTAVRLHATEVSNSYGGPETASASHTTSVIAAYNHPGVVITAATGDDGWYDWDLANAAGGKSDDAPNAPAALPTVVAVGGTSLTLTSTNTRHAETVWDADGPEDSSVDSGASGGGCSKRYNAQSWQAQAGHYSATGCGSRRMTGDIAAVADPGTGFDVYDTYDEPGWGTVGGTSLSSPVIAAMWALAGGSGGVRYPSQSLYYNLVHHASTVFDVKTGGNSFCGGDTPANCADAIDDGTGGATNNPNQLGVGLTDCSFSASATFVSAFITNNKQCNATTGYDGPSGVGTPHGLGVFKKP